MVQGERQFDLIVRLQEQFRDNIDAIKNILIATPDGQNLPLSQFADIRVEKGASFIYREVNSRFIGIQFSVKDRDLAGAVEEARPRSSARSLPAGYTFDWGGEYQEYLAARAQMKVIVPFTIVLILGILFALYGNLKFPLIIMFSVLVTVPVGGLLALWLTDEFQRVVRFRLRRADGRRRADERHPLFVHQQAAAGRQRHLSATFDASMLRLRPIMMTALVACLGLLPAAMSTGVGSDSQKPFAIVIVGGLVSRLLISIFLAPVLYALVARRDDVLKV